MKDSTQVSAVKMDSGAIDPSLLDIGVHNDGPKPNPTCGFDFNDEVALESGSSQNLVSKGKLSALWPLAMSNNADFVDRNCQSK
jgi:hypothetical protein